MSTRLNIGVAALVIFLFLLVIAMDIDPTFMTALR